MVGPFGLKLIPSSESVIHFAELGVVFLLFLIGLEIQPSKLWSMRRHLFGLGGMQVLLSAAIFGAAAHVVGLSAQASIILGFSLSLSSTAYALQTMIERNEFNTESGRGSFSILLMQDLVAIPALAIIPLFALSDAAAPRSFVWVGALRSALTIVLVLVAGRFLIRPAFRFIAATRAREIFTAATLFIVLGVSVLMQKIGLSAALGTFVAGVLLADSEYRHEIETNLEPFKSLLMGLFFIAVGMGVSLDLILEKPLLVLALTTGYLLVKALVLYASARLFRLNHENSKRMALTISQGGEFAFVIFGMALQFQIAEASVLTLLTVVITLSMALSPLLNIINDALMARACKEEATEPVYDKISDEAPEVIIAGYGRFGQIFGRILRAQDIAFVAIDHDPDHIELVRRFGSKVYYGDASRVDLLESAGTARAKYFILAIDDVEVSLRTARTVREHFPNVTIMARARNRGHAFDLMDLGIQDIKRETFDSGINFVKDLLVKMGVPEVRALSVVERFKRHDEIQLVEQFKVRSDDKMFVSVAKQSTAQLAQVLSDDSLRSYLEPPKPQA